MVKIVVTINIITYLYIFGSRVPKARTISKDVSSPRDITLACRR